MTENLWDKELELWANYRAEADYRTQEAIINMIGTLPQNVILDNLIQYIGDSGWRFDSYYNLYRIRIFGVHYADGKRPLYIPFVKDGIDILITDLLIEEASCLID